VEFIALDFLKESPVANQDYYYVGSSFIRLGAGVLNIPQMKSIFHDWPDEDALKMLRGIKEAMHPASRLLIREPCILFCACLIT
jgi:hypothetical protein